MVYKVKSRFLQDKYKKLPEVVEVVLKSEVEAVLKKHGIQ